MPLSVPLEPNAHLQTSGDGFHRGNAKKRKEILPGDSCYVHHVHESISYKQIQRQ